MDSEKHDCRDQECRLVEEMAEQLKGKSDTNDESSWAGEYSASGCKPCM